MSTKPVFIFPSRAKLIRHTIFWTLLLIVSLFVLIFNSYIIGFALTMFCLALATPAAITAGFALSYYLRRLISRDPVLVIDQEGIIDAASYSPAGRIEWREIEGYKVVKSNFQKYLVVKIKNPVNLYEDQKGFKRVLASSKIKRMGSSVVIPSNILPMKPVDLLHQIRNRG